MQGPEVEAFEREFADFCGIKHCVALSTGTAALHLGLLALGVQSGDEVITTPNSFLATAEAITYCGASPVSWILIPPPPIWIRGSSNAPSRRARAPFFPCISTAAPQTWTPSAKSPRVTTCAFWKTPRKRMARAIAAAASASLGQAAAFSFYPTKNLGAYGEGGALTTNDDPIAKFARAARSHGQTARYDHEFLGYNYRMQGFQGAVLRIKLRRLYAWTQKRREIANEYRRLLAGARLEIPLDDPRDECVYHQFVVYVNNRNALIAHLAARGIDTAVHYPKPIHLQPAYSSLGYPPEHFRTPNAPANAS